MKGDFTRTTFKKEKHYSGVRMQQGRVQLDADWNEQVDIQTHRNETEGTDVIGACGAPKDHAGFELTPDGTTLKISKGRLYVEGMLCENEAPVTYEDQPDFHGEALPTESGFYLAYLDVWQRHISAVEDSDLLEPALNGVDTTTRTKTVWQVKLHLLGTSAPDNIESACDIEILGGGRDENPGRMAARVNRTGQALREPCLASPRAGFRGVENQLYRVEIHTAGKVGSNNPPKFKWSRNNGMVASPITSIISQEGSIQINVGQPARDDILNYSPGDWVEVIDDDRELNGGRGVLARVKNVSEGGQKLVIDPATADDEITPTKFAKNVRVRRWDQPGSTRIRTASSRWTPLEDGIEVKFNKDDELKTGDYWLIPARTITGDIDWPRDEKGNSILQPRLKIEHHFCALAIFNLNANGKWILKHDCRKLFSPLVEQFNLFYISGDGQGGLPGSILGQNLQVGVTNGQHPIKGAEVEFQVEIGDGFVTIDKNDPKLFDKTISAITDNRGIATCFWRLEGPEDDKNDPNFKIRPQKVRARLKMFGRYVHLPVFFNANLTQIAERAFYRLPECENPPTLKSLLETAIKGKWDYDSDGSVTLNDIMDILLCHLKAETIPFDSKCNTGIYSENIAPNVAAALRALCNLMARHVNYEVPDCRGRKTPTVKALLEITDKTVSLKEVLDAVLCDLNADTIPFHDTSDPRQFPETITTVARALLHLSERSQIPCGAIMPFARTTRPSGWLECNGDEVTAEQFPELFDVLKPNFTGPDGKVRLPDLRGEFVRGWDNGRGVDPFKQESPDNKDRPLGSPQDDRIIQHTHKEVEEEGHSHSIGDEAVTGTDINLQFGGRNIAFSSSGHRTSAVSVQLCDAVDSEGNPVQQSTETRPRNVAMMYCIKT